jgi:hypothetical protein
MIGFFCTKEARRTLAIDSNASTPMLAPIIPMEAKLTPTPAGLRLEADHPGSGSY